MQQIPKKFIRMAIVILSVSVLVFLGFYAYRSTQFRLVKTDPKLSKIATISPSITLYFSQPIDQDSFKLVDPREIIANTAVREKQVELRLGRDLNNNQQYSITFSVKSLSGQKAISNQKLTFKARYIDSQDLPKEQRQQLLDNQDQPIYDVDHLNYKNFDSLLDFGISSGQLVNVKTALYDYSNVAKKKFWTMSLVPNSIVVTNHNPDSQSSIDRADFSVILDKTYKVHIEYQAAYDSVYTQIFDSSGIKVYDSANVADTD